MKKVCQSFSVALKGRQIERVRAYTLRAVVGDLYYLTLDIYDDGRVEIEEGERGHPHGMRVGTNRKVVIQGVDMSDWTKSYERVSQVGEIDYYRIELQADSEVMSINGMHPWEESP